eukprot:EG_transcript_3888
MILFTPLSGAQGEGPLCYLLELDDFKLLLDCGWNDSFEPAQFDSLKAVAEDIDAVLISHPDLMHLGGLPYAMAHLGLKAPVFATLPVQKMGEMHLYDAERHRTSREDFNLFSLDDIDMVFERFVQLKYFQRYKLEGKGRGIVITPFPAGHSIGGSVWRISKETDDILYAVDYHHKKERVLPSIDLAALGKPTVTITDAFNAMRLPVRPDRDERLIDTILGTLRADGNVLIPCDTAGRIFELLMLLDSRWEQHSYPYRVAVVSNVAHRTVEFARGMLEWMNDNVHRRFDESRYHPMKFQHFHFLHSMEELDELRAERRPMVVIATPASMNTGFSLEVFASFAGSDHNAVVFVEQGPEGSVARTVIDEYFKRQRHGKAAAPLVTVDLARKVPIEGDELREWQERVQEEEEKERRREEQQLKRVIQIKDEKGDDADPMEELMETAPSLSGHQNPRLFLPKSLVYSSQHLMFPCRDRPPPPLDQYGAALDPALLEVLQGRQTEIAVGYTPIPKPALPADLQDRKRERPIPTKSRTETLAIAIQCAVHVFDLEGRADGTSVKVILSDKRLLNTKKMILIHGSQQSTRLLQDWCLDKQVCDEVYAPEVGEKIDVSNDVQMYKIKLRDELLSRMNFQPANDYQVAFVEGEVLHMAGTEAMDVDLVDELTAADVNRKKRGLNLSLADRDLPSLADITATEHPSRGHPTVLIGDVTLSKFARVLVGEGWRTEFKDGCLICDEKVVLRMKREGDISIEGMLCPEYFQVRDLLYQQYRML